MDSLAPWIADAAQRYLVETDPSKAISQASAPLRTGIVQFIRFLTPHILHSPSDQGVWAEATDRQISVHVHIPRQVLTAFEIAQAADARRLSQLSFPIFQLGGARWVWDHPTLPKNSTPTNATVEYPKRPPQLCLRLVTDLERKVFKLKTEMPAILSSHTLDLESHLHRLKNGIDFLAAARLELDRAKVQLGNEGKSVTKIIYRKNIRSKNKWKLAKHAALIRFQKKLPKPTSSNVRPKSSPSYQRIMKQIESIETGRDARADKGDLSNLPKTSTSDKVLVSTKETIIDESGTAGNTPKNKTDHSRLYNRTAQCQILPARTNTPIPDPNPLINTVSAPPRASVERKAQRSGCLIKIPFKRTLGQKIQVEGIQVGRMDQINKSDKSTLEATRRTQSKILSTLTDTRTSDPPPSVKTVLSSARCSTEQQADRTRGTIKIPFKRKLDRSANQEQFAAPKKVALVSVSDGYHNLPLSSRPSNNTLGVDPQPCCARFNRVCMMTSNRRTEESAAHHSVNSFPQPDDQYQEERFTSKQTAAHAAHPVGEHHNPSNADASPDFEEAQLGHQNAHPTVAVEKGLAPDPDESRSHKHPIVTAHEYIQKIADEAQAVAGREHTSHDLPSHFLDARNGPRAAHFDGHGNKESGGVVGEPRRMNRALLARLLAASQVAQQLRCTTQDAGDGHPPAQGWATEDESEKQDGPSHPDEAGAAAYEHPDTPTTIDRAVGTVEVDEIRQRLPLPVPIMRATDRQPASKATRGDGTDQHNSNLSIMSNNLGLSNFQLNGQVENTDKADQELGSVHDLEGEKVEDRVELPIVLVVAGMTVNVKGCKLDKYRQSLRSSS